MNGFSLDHFLSRAGLMDESGLEGVDFLSSAGGTGSLFDGFCSPLSEYNGAEAEMTLGGALRCGFSFEKTK